ncbi:uncharacterized protein LOC117318555 [Pecten maximus]|uniref:uncharacterized protein LOC117318555 n=1 Tax=Pecten maximus TaxID=6579 RepID=UPI0014590790|nr:uncharacterized protein LOC117318555 [Pecten maximus]
MGILDDSQEGYILEVDLYYPSELHDLHNDYPLAPERIQATADMLSPFASKLLEDLGLKGTSTEKLIPLNPKTKYLLHYRNLKQYLSLGMKLTKVHRVLSFQQSPWLKTYIDFPDEQGTFYQSELQKVEVRDDDMWKVENILKTRGKGRNKQHFVKWLHWPKKFNSWIRASDVTDL